MFDSHCHLDDPAFDADRGAVLARAERAGVLGIVVPGYAPETWHGLRAFCEQSALLSCALGLHPWHVHTLSEEARHAALRALPEAAEAQGAVAIGECGLDKKKAQHGGASLALQRDVLHAHLAAARALGLPVILHCVDAHGPLLALLEAVPRLPRGGVLHSYSGSAELVPRYAALGLSFSFAGSLTRPGAHKPRRAACAVPSERLLVESDGPDQALAALLPALPSNGPYVAGDGAQVVTPEPRQARSEPAHVRFVLHALAQLRGEPLEMVAQRTTDNALGLFRPTRV